ncbi:MAG: hypothetical protein Q4A64_06700 [Porphyromonadaceae bacterium]|nr:hypothetical protein [Porphyromonadaceae bacterium]
MIQLSELNKHCLANMPELIDAICSTCLKLKNILDDINKIFNRKLQIIGHEYRLSLEEEEEQMDVLNDAHSPSIGIRYDVLLRKKLRGKKEFALHIWWGYYCDGENKTPNTISFCCTEDEESCGALTLEQIERISETLPQEWLSGILGEDTLYTEFKLDTSLSEKKIKDCMDAFLTYVLEPILEGVQI